MFQDADEATERSRVKAARDIDYYDGRQWTEKEVKALEKRGQPAITLNLIRNKIDYLQGQERAQRSKPRALPRTPADEDQAHAATDALSFIADQNKYDDKRSRVWGDLLRAGWGGYEIGVEQTQDGSYDVTVKRCEWDRMFWDPFSVQDDFSDAAYLGMVMWMDRDDAVRTYGDEAAKVFDETVSGDTLTFADKPQHEIWVRNGMRRRIRIVQMYYLDPDDGQWSYAEFTKGGILLSAPSPWVDEDGERQHGYEWRSAYVDRDNNRYGAVRDMIDPQDEMNKRRSKALHLFTARQTFSTAGSLGKMTVKEMRDQLSRPDGHVSLAAGVKYGEDFGPIQTNDMAAGHMELLQQAAAVFETMGPNAAMQGKQSGAPSGRALLASQQGGQVQLGTLTDGLRQMDYAVFRKMWLRVKQFWTGETWIRVTDDQNNLQWVGLNQQAVDPQTGMPAMKNDVTSLDVDIIIDEAPSNGTIADEQFAMLLQLKQMDAGNEIPFSALIAAAPNLRNKAELVQAIKEREQQPPNPLEVAGAQAKVQDAQAGAALKAAQAQKTQAEVPRVASQIALDQASARKTVVETHGHATGSLLDAATIASMLQQPLVQTPANYTVPAPA